MALNPKVLYYYDYRTWCLSGIVESFLYLFAGDSLFKLLAIFIIIILLSSSSILFLYNQLLLLLSGKLLLSILCVVMINIITRVSFSQSLFSTSIITIRSI